MAARERVRQNGALKPAAARARSLGVSIIRSGSAGWARGLALLRVNLRGGVGRLGRREPPRGGRRARDGVRSCESREGCALHPADSWVHFKAGKADGSLWSSAQRSEVGLEPPLSGFRAHIGATVLATALQLP